MLVISDPQMYLVYDSVHYAITLTRNFFGNPFVIETPFYY